MPKIDLERALKYIFEDKEWVKKVAPFALVMLVVSILSNMLQLTTNFSSVIADSVEARGSALMATLLLSFVPALLLILLSLALIPFYIYLKGYMLQVMRNVYTEALPTLPEHQPLAEKFRLFFSYFLVVIGPILISMIIFGAMLIPMIFSFVAFAGNENPMFLIVGIFSVMLFVLFAICFAVVFQGVIQPAMIYIYFKTGNVKAAYSLKNLGDVIKKGWVKLLVTGVVIYAISMVVGFLVLFSWFCLMGWLMQPIATVYLMLVSSYLYGDVYKQLDETRVLEV